MPRRLQMTRLFDLLILLFFLVAAVKNPDTSSTICGVARKARRISYSSDGLFRRGRSADGRGWLASDIVSVLVRMAPIKCNLSQLFKQMIDYDLKVGNIDFAVTEPLGEGGKHWVAQQFDHER